MTTKEAVLNFLVENSSEYISGEAIAKSLGKSRAAIWKAIKALKSDGYAIDAVTNRGYKLNNDNDILSSETVRAKLENDIKVYYYTSLDSTNNQAKRLVADGENSDMLIISETQTAGRGRQGKSFYSPPLTGIYMTYVTHPNTPLKNAVTATTAAAVAVCRAIEALTDRHPKIKWVNDVYIGENKICGILTEAVTDFESGTVSSVIIGIGTNIKTIDFPSDIKNASSLNCDVKRADLIAAICNELHKINNSDYSDFIEYYRKHSMIIGREINYIQNGKVTPAVAVEIDETGGLVVQNENGLTTLRSGEISIRRR